MAMNWRIAPSGWWSANVSNDILLAGTGLLPLFDAANAGFPLLDGAAAHIAEALRQIRA